MKNYYVTLTVVGWIDVFTSKQYSRELIRALKSFQEKKGLRLYAWLIMSNQVHLVFQCEKEPEVLLKKVKQYSAARLIRRIEKNEAENRSSWLMHMLCYFGKYNRENENFQFWLEDKALMEVESHDELVKTLNRVIHIPVTERIVSQPEHYVYSSANEKSALALAVLSENGRVHELQLLE
jgi:putative transposase